MGACTSERTENRGDEAKKFYNSLPSQKFDDQPKERAQLTVKLSNCDSSSKYQVSLILYTNKEKNLGEEERYTEAMKAKNGVVIFKESVICDYYFEKTQPMVLKVKKDDMFYQQFDVNLGAIMGARDKAYHIEIPNGEKIELLGRSLVDCNMEMKIHVEITKSGSSNHKYWFLISYLGEDPHNKEKKNFLFKSEQKDHFSQISFDDVNIPISLLTNNTNNQNISYISIEIFSEVRKQKLGELVDTVANLQHKTSPVNIPNSIENIFVTVKTDIFKQFSFLDYLTGGMQLALSIAIDFTASNKNIDDPTSLHYFTEEIMSPYEKAIRSCGDIVAYYDYDQLFPVFGYGAIIPNENVVNHCFNLTMNPNPNINTINEVLLQYRRILPTLKLYGPTFFAPLIKNLINIVKKSDKNEYHVLMILTDGQINDMNYTIDALVEASFLPISIIIIGIGDGDFENMVTLDANINPLFDTNGKRQQRDIVQFVKFSDFQNAGEKLAESVLKEVPWQIVEYYYKINNITPSDSIFQQQLSQGYYNCNYNYNYNE